MNEALFESCFHTGFETAQNRLRTYLHRAVQASCTVASVRPSALGEFAIRRATRAEIARIKGGIELLEASCIRPEYPEVYEDYLTTARHSLRHAYDAGERDPAVVAELALCELDLGNVADSRPLIEEAVRLNAVMPRVLFRARAAALCGAAEPDRPVQCGAGRRHSRAA